jgi:hypothetical protein
VQSLAAVEPTGAVLSALTARHGHPGELTARVYESAGRPTRARVRLWTGVAAAHTTDLLGEEARAALAVHEGAVELPLAPAEVATLALVPARATATGDGVPLGPAAEAAQPVFARYWLHNKGPAPLGGLPVTLHLTPDRLTVSTTTAPARGTVELAHPPGLTVQAPPLDYDLPPDAFAEYPLAVTAAPGLHHLTARLRDPLGQTVEDTLAFRSGEDAPDEPLAITLARPTDNHLLLRIANLTDGEIRGDVQPLSPFGTWGPEADVLVTPWIQPFAAPPGGEPRELLWTLTRPPTARPGARLWCVLRVAAFGRVHYTEAVPLAVG